jgi:hypothetical protein
MRCKEVSNFILEKWYENEKGYLISLRAGR